MSSQDGPERNVLCMKWGSKYPATYVNRLHSMVRRNLGGAFRFVCLTDDPAGVDDGVECLPIPFVSADRPGRDGGWRKLATFEAPLYDLRGLALFLDLDVVVLRDLEPFFTLDGDFLIARDTLRPSRAVGNSSVYRFRIGAHKPVVDAFRADEDAVLKAFRNEQAYLSARMKDAGALGYWPEGWCRSFKYDCLPGWPMNYLRDAVAPPDARIVFFHGRPRPHEAVEGFSGLRRFTRPTPWVAEHWR